MTSHISESRDTNGKWFQSVKKTLLFLQKNIKF